jgi:hypothetical protein
MKEAAFDKVRAGRSGMRGEPPIGGGGRVWREGWGAIRNEELGMRGDGDNFFWKMPFGVNRAARKP